MRAVPTDHECCCIPATSEEIMDTINQVEEDLKPEPEPEPQTYTFSISADPSDATIKINGVTQSSITVEKGTTVTYEVSKGLMYTRVTGSYQVNSDYTLEVQLEIDIYIVARTGQNAPVSGGELSFGAAVRSTGSYLQSDAYELVSNVSWLTFSRASSTNYYMTAAPNTGSAREAKVSLYLKEEFWDEYQGNFEYYKELYGVELDFVTITQEAAPEEPLYTFSITTNPDIDEIGGHIYIDNKLRDSISVPKNTEVSYRVEADLYYTIPGTYKVTSDYTLNIDMQAEFYLTPYNYRVEGNPLLSGNETEPDQLKSEAHTYYLEIERHGESAEVPVANLRFELIDPTTASTPSWAQLSNNTQYGDRVDIHFDENNTGTFRSVVVEAYTDFRLGLLNPPILLCSYELKQLG